MYHKLGCAFVVNVRCKMRLLSGTVNWKYQITDKNLRNNKCVWILLFSYNPELVSWISKTWRKRNSKLIYFLCISSWNLMGTNVEANIYIHRLFVWIIWNRKCNIFFWIVWMHYADCNLIWKVIFVDVDESN